MLEQFISILGAIMVLVAYASQQTGKLESNGLIYLGLNLAGAFILGVIAIRAKQIGLTIVEVAWGCITVASLFRKLRSAQRSDRDNSASAAK